MRRSWIKIYVDQCLRGTMFDEMNDPAERFIWFGFLLLAGDSPFEGKIALTESMGYTDEQLAALLRCDKKTIKKAKEIMVKYDKIKILENNVVQIVNWKKYQSEYDRQKQYRDPDATKVTSKVTSKSYKQKLQAKVTSKGDKQKEKEKEKEKENNNKDKKPLCPKSEPSDVDISLTQHLIFLMTGNDPNSRVIRNLTEKRKLEWINSCRLMRERDNRTKEEILAIIEFSQDDEFWKSNILSMPKLREKFDQLKLKARVPNAIKTEREVGRSTRQPTPEQKKKSEEVETFRESLYKKYEKDFADLRKKKDQRGTELLESMIKTEVANYTKEI